MNVKIVPDAPTDAPQRDAALTTLDAAVIEQLARAARRYGVIVSLTVSPYDDRADEDDCDD